ncbi:hypothetical protein HU200_031107 [Digitaria exilis]|uniref:PIR2-like helical domain-containing protein n=1 Tax=Digitaria exilis TaxID=1010633 RepID=A0A835ERH3_9POAL|nr:hypothetical protein HU200_031107 [Digitaria exilis]
MEGPGSSSSGKGKKAKDGGGDSAGTGTFSCFHGEWRPVDEATLMDANEIRRRFIDGFYEEAARRLPLKEIPGLDGCIRASGLCVGLADPVANIILNAVGLLLHDRQEQEEHRPLPPQREEFRVSRGSAKGWADIAYRSLDGLRGFMTAYFRYLGYTQAARYLYLASHHLPLATRLVHHDRFGPRSFSQEQRRLLPDGGKLKGALRIAAVQSKHPAPDLLAQLMTAQYPPDMLSRVVAKLQGTEPLTAIDVSEIMALLACRWPPTPSPVNMEFWCRPNGTTCTRHQDGALLVSTCIGEGLVADISIRTDQKDQFQYITDLTFHCGDMEAKLSECLQAAGEISGTGMETIVNYDAFRCEHIVTLEMCLLDTIHTFYITALAILPRRRSTLRALIVAGHCYGTMDPVSNIILNSIWYEITFPPTNDDKVELPQGILDTRPMFRLASHSLDGLVEMARKTCRSRHEALQHLNSSDCNMFRGKFPNEFDFNVVAKAAKHPQHAAHGFFLMFLLPVNFHRLHLLLTGARGSVTWPYFEDKMFNQSHPAVYDYRACTGRCSFCENEGSKIVHPPSGGHYGVVDGRDDLYPSAVNGVGFKGLLDSDFIYFDPHRDVELAKVINDPHAYGCNDMPAMTWTQGIKPSFAWEWSADGPFGPLPEISGRYFQA